MALTDGHKALAGIEVAQPVMAQQAHQEKEEGKQQPVMAQQAHQEKEEGSRRKPADEPLLAFYMPGGGPRRNFPPLLFQLAHANDIGSHLWLFLEQNVEAVDLPLA